MGYIPMQNKLKRIKNKERIGYPSTNQHWIMEASPSSERSPQSSEASYFIGFFFLRLEDLLWLPLISYHNDYKFYIFNDIYHIFSLKCEMDIQLPSFSDGYSVVPKPFAFLMCANRCNHHEKFNF